MKKNKVIIMSLFGLNFITLSLLVLMSSHHFLPNSNGKYAENYQYNERRTLFEIYKPVKPIKIVMLGNSITQKVDWNELLTRTDVVNRGIGSDVTEGLINRLSDVCLLNPKMCFIMAGINDLAKGASINQVVQNYLKIIEKLQNNKITPIIQSTLYVSPKIENWKEINKKVDGLNMILKKYANKEGILFLDINSELSKNGALDAIYTRDGIHLLGNGYAKWRDLILSNLE